MTNGDRHRDTRTDRTAALLTITAAVISVFGTSAWHIYTYGSIQWGPAPVWVQLLLGAIFIPATSYGMYIILREVRRGESYG